MRVAIIEDELLAFKELKRMLLNIDSNITISEHFKSLMELESSFNSNEYDLIFCDVNLTDGNSFSFLDKIQNDIPIIFTTAFEKYALSAFKYNSIDYLLKPFSKEELKSAILKFQRRIKSTKIDLSSIKDLLNEKDVKTKKNRFLVKSGNKYSYIETKDIAYFYVEDKITYGKTFSNNKFILDESLNKIEPILDDTFFRVTRNMICSIHSIESASKFFNSRLIVTLNLPHTDEIIVSRVNVDSFLNWLNT